MRVRIKPYEKIEKTLDENNETRGMYFNGEMKRMCGREFETDGYDDGRVRYSGWYWVSDWLEPVKPKLTVEIDPDDPTEAHRIVSEAIKQYRYGWTEDEIAEAIRVTDEEILKLHHEHKSPVFYCYSNAQRVVASLGFGTNRTGTVREVRPCDGDVFNEEIGRCVAICKLTGRKIPEFIMKKGVSK